MKNKSNIPSTIHYLNNILSKSQFSRGTNKLFDGLIIPPGFCVNKNHPNSNIKIQCSNSECIDANLYLKLIKLAEKHNTTPKKKSKKKRTKNTRKIQEK